MSKNLRDADYLAHIAEAIGRISSYVGDEGETGFLQDKKTQDAVIRNFEIIGEAVTKLSDELKANHSEIPWGEIAGMRHRLIHGYFAVNLNIVWSTIERVLPEFERQVRTLQSALTQRGN